MLTRKQLLVLNFIDVRTKAEGIAPTLDEISDALVLGGKGNAQRFVSILVKKGFLTRKPSCARALQVLRLPHTDSAGQSPASTAPRETVDG